MTMKILFIVRSTLFKVRGGDTVQVTETAAALQALGLRVDIKLAAEKINYDAYDLLHFFNITRPADMLVHIRRSRKPYVLTPIRIDYSKYDKQRQGVPGMLLKRLSPAAAEYVKTVGRFVSGRDRLPSPSFIWKGQYRSIQEVLRSAKCILVNSETEYRDIAEEQGMEFAYAVIPNGINPHHFAMDPSVPKDPTLVLCAARIEGIKNQLSLVQALNNTRFTLLLAGDPAPGQLAYYRQCRKKASRNIIFTGHLSRVELLQYYQKAKVHVLPSWFELCGLSSLEAAAMGCAVVISPNGYAKDYFGDAAYYCDPEYPASILKAIETASAAAPDSVLQQRISNEYSWQRSAEKIVSVYKNYVN